MCPDWFLQLGCQVNDGNKSINKSIILLNLVSSPVTLALHTLLPVNSLTGGITLKSLKTESNQKETSLYKITPLVL